MVVGGTREKPSNSTLLTGWAVANPRQTALQGPVIRGIKEIRSLWYCPFEPFGATACTPPTARVFCSYHEGEHREENGSRAEDWERWLVSTKKMWNTCFSSLPRFCLSVSSAPQTVQFPHVQGSLQAKMK